MLTCAARLPGAIVRGREFEHPGRGPAAGLLFFNDEATETGGLIYAGRAEHDAHSSGVHLSYDNYEQDQVIVLASSDDGPGERLAQLEFVDRPDWSIVRLFDPPQVDTAAAPALPPDASGVRRMRLARETDGSVGLSMCDTQGHPRLTLRVDQSGDAALIFLDQEGGTVATYPER